jgi:FlaA1/EpsC-like NDP-sugar epimerase
MKNNPFYKCNPLGFVDDDRSKVGNRIHGVPVLGTREELATIIDDTEPDELLIAMPREERAVIRGIVRSLQPFKIKISILPNLPEVMSGRATVTHARPLAIEDLLARPRVDLDQAVIHRMIEGKRVLVTGAGGSIGSELCRQVAALAPRGLAMVERYENGLYSVASELSDNGHAECMRAYIADITDRSRISAILSDFAPQIVFHAAAHKHVPLMELNPCEAVKNNVAGTRILVGEAARCGVERFVLISTDKAVNPTSVMGATKRVAELLVQAIDKGPGTNFSVVRFGNVLGSSGSVVPRFLTQIEAGGPVTVTDPEMRRYFMLIPEAVQLVLQAAAHAATGTVYLLEMGDQIKVADLARNLIRLAGYVPDEEIGIDYVGLRPGEKLYEELVGSDESVESSEVAEILRVVGGRHQPWPVLSELVARLEDAASVNDDKAVVDILRFIVQTFEPAARVPSESVAFPNAGRSPRAVDSSDGQVVFR